MSFEGIFSEGSFSDIFRSASKRSLDDGARAITSEVTRISSFGILAIFLFFLYNHKNHKIGLNVLHQEILIL